MAEVKRKKLELVGKEQERRPRKKNPCSGCDLECSTCLVSGARTMREAACRTVKQKSAEIADWLGTNAANGDVNSTKLLLSLAGPQTDKGRTRNSRSGGSAANDFASEPRWQEPVDKLDAETASGGRESEG
jgi:hypothetical protein